MSLHSVNHSIKTHSCSSVPQTNQKCMRQQHRGLKK